MPYIRGIRERTESLCRHLKIRTIFQSNNTLRTLLVHVKNRVPDGKKKGEVYQIPCKECNLSYIGETGRTLKKRMTDHRAAVRRGDTNNGIAVHAWSEGHQVDWEGTKVIAVAPHLWKRRVVEALMIQSTTPGLWTPDQPLLEPSALQDITFRSFSPIINTLHRYHYIITYLICKSVVMQFCQSLKKTHGSKGLTIKLLNICYENLNSLILSSSSNVLMSLYTFIVYILYSLRTHQGCLSRSGWGGHGRSTFWSDLCAAHSTVNSRLWLIGTLDDRFRHVYEHC